MTKRKRTEISLLFGLLFAVALCFAGFEADCSVLRSGSFRLRVIAASDSAADQELKLKVRDEILKATAADFAACENAKQAKSTAQKNIARTKALARRVIEENGFSYGCTARVKRQFFSTCDYGDFTLPAGEYESLVVTLGKGEGHNWWCVLFPGVCVPAAAGKQSFEALFSDEAAAVACGQGNYTVRFKAAEIYEKIKEKCKKIKK